MKRLSLLIFLALMIPVSSFAAGTVIETIEYDHHDVYGHVVVLKYAITADAAAGTVPNTTISLRTVDDVDTSQFINLSNFYIYSLKTVPGAGDAQPDAYTVDIQDGDSFSWVDIGNRSQTAAEVFDCSDTIGIFPPVTEDMTLVVGNLGNSNTATIYIYLTK